MGFLTDLWKQFCEFLGIEAVEPIVPEEPPKSYEPVESVTALPEKTPAITTVELIEPLPTQEIIAPTPIGEQGRADRIEVLPAKIEEKRAEAPKEEIQMEMKYYTYAYKASDGSIGTYSANALQTDPKHKLISTADSLAESRAQREQYESQHAGQTFDEVFR